MSGLEVLAALSLACNVMQTISFCADVVRLSKNVYQTGKPDPTLVGNSESLASLADSLGHQVAGQAQPLTRADHNLLESAQKTAEAAKELREEVDRLAVPAGAAGLRAKLSAATGVWKTLWKKSRFERLEKTIADLQRGMETGILVGLRSKLDAVDLRQIQQQDDFDAAFRRFLQELATGCTEISRLVQHESTALQAVVRSEASWVEQSVGARLTREFATREVLIERLVASSARETQTALENEMRRRDEEATSRKTKERFLGSLQFPEVNARKNQVDDSAPRTFNWVLRIGEPPRGHETGEAEAKGKGEEILPPWDDFVDFLESEATLYWVSGKPGSGKSTLMKFIEGRQETRDALNRWRPDTAILSHYFWLPGGEMQKNMKGMLCSLLHQAYTTSDVPALTQELRRKNSPMDWSVSELRRLAIGHFQAASRPYCVFIDGLDEVRPESSLRELLDLVQELQALPQMKLCVASRPEPPVQRRLGSFPGLQIHRLTAGDLREYAQSSIPLTADIQPLFTSHSRVGYSVAPELRYKRFVEDVVEKAQGVFLWLALAIKQLRSGIERRDSLAQLNQRLEEMPGDLAGLYHDMWLRHDMDHVIYRPIISRLLRLQLTIRTPRRVEWSVGPLKHDLPSVFELAIASAEVYFLRGFLETGLLSAQQLEERCKTTRDDINSRCAGLLEISEREGHRVWEGVGRRCQEPRGGPYSPLLPYTDLTVDFIHRTAYDFLTNTLDGQAILLEEPHGPSPQERLIEAGLTRCVIWLFLAPTFTNPHTGVPYPYDRDEGLSISGNSLDGFLYWLGRCLRRGEVDLEGGGQLLRQFEAVYEAGHLFSGRHLLDVIDGDVNSYPCLRRAPFLWTALHSPVHRLVGPHEENKNNLFALLHQRVVQSLASRTDWNPGYLAAILHAACDIEEGWGVDPDRSRLARSVLQAHLKATHHEHHPGFPTHANGPTVLDCLERLVGSLFRYYDILYNDVQPLSQGSPQSFAMLEDYEEQAAALLRELVQACQNLDSRVIVFIYVQVDVSGKVSSDYPNWKCRITYSEDTGGWFWDPSKNWTLTRFAAEINLSVLVDVVRSADPEVKIRAPGWGRDTIDLAGCRIVAMTPVWDYRRHELDPFFIVSEEDSKTLNTALAEHRCLEMTAAIQKVASHSEQFVGRLTDYLAQKGYPTRFSVDITKDWTIPMYL